MFQINNFPSFILIHQNDYKQNTTGTLLCQPMHLVTNALIFSTDGVLRVFRLLIKLISALTISQSLPDVRSTALKKLAYRTSRNEVVTTIRQKRKNPKKRSNTIVANSRINKIQMSGAACELTTDDITKFCEQQEREC